VRRTKDGIRVVLPILRRATVLPSISAGQVTGRFEEAFDVVDPELALRRSPRNELADVDAEGLDRACQTSSFAPPPPVFRSAHIAPRLQDDSCQSGGLEVEVRWLIWSDESDIRHADPMPVNVWRSCPNRISLKFPVGEHSPSPPRADPDGKPRRP